MRRHNQPNRTAIVLAFPPSHRKDLVIKVARQMAARPPTLAERHLKQQLDRQSKAMRRTQVPGNEIERLVRALESAIRSELWRQVLDPPQPTGGHRWAKPH
jgi:hypothetical protein